MRRVRRTAGSITLVLTALTTFAGPPASAVDPPTVRLYAATDPLIVERSRRDVVWLDPGVWVAAVGGALELRASRPDYDTPVGLEQLDPGTGDVLRTLDAGLLDGWSGLKRFLHVTIRDKEGKVVLRGPNTFCPNSYSRARLTDEGPLTPSYPYFCGGNPFTKGAIYGIDDGWAVSGFGDYYGIVFEAPRRHYTVRVWIDRDWVDALGIAPGDAEVNFALRVEDRGTLGPARRAARGDAAYAPAPKVPDTTSPPAESLPDLVALPAWGMRTYSRRGHDYLAFNATEWDAGPGTLVVEGFRPQNADTMDAFQYFLVNGEAVGRTQVGSLEFHAKHRHWHFQQFTEYSLLDADSAEVQLSGKQSWCLANTDALDLSVPNANWAAYGGDIFTMCGGPSAIWIREILDVGWGDTYSQSVPGQAFDITDLPNGKYYVRVTVNPTDLLLETTTANNVEDRLIRLRGQPGNRSVVVPPWHGIDTEGCFYCG